MSTFFQISSVRATVYFVGGPNGWTPMFDANGLTLDYTEWQSPKTFQFAVFHYLPNEDNLIQVTHEDFERCNLDSPIKEQKLEIIVNPSPSHFPTTLLTTAPHPLSMPPTSQSNLPTSTAVKSFYYSSMLISIIIMALAYVFLY
ncbi:hypothetical protein ACFE04_028743 [Oxalis oulophora]